jgi:hypothetical protein
MGEREGERTGRWERESERERGGWEREREREARNIATSICNGQNVTRIFYRRK